MQLFSCCDSNLKAKVTAVESDILAKDFDSMLELLKYLAVIPEAVNFKIRCPHTHTTADNNFLIDYTNEMIRHVILNGLYDDEIRQNIFGQRDLEKMAITKLVSLIEGKETAREATTCPSANVVSQYMRGERLL